MSTTKPNTFDFIIGKPPFVTNKNINPSAENENAVTPKTAFPTNDSEQSENGTMPAEKVAPAVNKPTDGGVIQPIVNSILPENKPTNNDEPKQATHLPPIVPFPIVKNIRPGKIITSLELVRLKFDTLKFHDKWNSFFGNPGVNFYLIIHGMAGEGKSTFAIQFAKYLSENHGKALYISGEEGISKTLMDKFVNTNSMSDSLHVVELKSVVDIIRVVEPGVYHFVFIDSIQHLNIGAGKMRDLRERYKNTAFISISQSTKGGVMRGSYEHSHDSDILVEVTKGLAITTKNRYKLKGEIFNVFEAMEPAKDGVVVSNDIIDVQSIGPDKPMNLEDLELHLTEALAKEDFEAAAKLRDMIAKMKNK